MKIKDYIVLIVLVVICSGIKAQSIYGNFPYYQSFKSTLKPNEIEIVTPQGGKKNSTTFTSEGLQLTPATTQNFGAIFIKDRQFQSIQGIRLEFEYAMYGGSGADGMSVFLFDASVENPTIGAPGAAIGYAYNRANNTNLEYRASGLSGAYLGIALDSYGNFKHKRWQGDARVSGIPDITTSNSNVTIRGAQGGETQLSDFPYSGMGKGYNGYPVLISQPTLNNSLGWKLHATNGTYSNLNSYKGDFSLRGTSKSDYRKAMIEIFPFPDKTGFWITVKIQHGQVATTVIEDYEYKKTVVYAENAYTSEGDYNILNPTYPSSKNTILNATIPQYLRIGFAASTGALTDIHLIREVQISLPSAAEAYDDLATTTKEQPVVIDVLDNDNGYSGLITKRQEGFNYFLNPYAFRFCNETGGVIGTVEENETYYSDVKGTWLFNFITGKLTYTPANNFIGESFVRYNIKAGLNNELPYSDEAYRSMPAVVTVNVTPPIPPKAIISNRMITPVVIP